MSEQSLTIKLQTNVLVAYFTHIMRTHTFMSMHMSRIALMGAVVAVATLGLLSVALPAQAQVTPTVTGVVRDTGNNATSTVSVGAMIHLRATVASSTSSTSPSGTADFIRYNGTICSGTGTTFESNTTLAGGIADSDPIEATAGGMSFRVHYDGQGDMFSQATSSCVALSVNQFNPSLALTLSSTTIYAGSSVYASSSLSNASSSADGTVMYRIYSNNTCTNLYESGGTKTVTNTSVPNSNSIQFNTPGTYYWQGVYSGDENTLAATSTCANAVLNVLATSTATSTTGDGSIRGTVYNDLNKNRSMNAGEPGLSGFTVWLFKLPVKHFQPSYAFRSTVSDGNGDYAFNDLPDGTYRVELKEQKENGWNQNTPDYKSLVISNGTDLTDKDFGNASTTNNGGNNGNGGNDNGNNNNFWWFIRGILFEAGGNGSTSDFLDINKNFFQNLFGGWNR